MPGSWQHCWSSSDARPTRQPIFRRGKSELVKPRPRRPLDDSTTSNLTLPLAPLRPGQGHGGNGFTANGIGRLAGRASGYKCGKSLAATTGRGQLWSGPELHRSWHDRRGGDPFPRQNPNWPTRSKPKSILSATAVLTLPPLCIAVY